MYLKTSSLVADSHQRIAIGPVWSSHRRLLEIAKQAWLRWWPEI